MKRLATYLLIVLAACLLMAGCKTTKTTTKTKVETDVKTETDGTYMATTTDNRDIDMTKQLSVRDKLIGSSSVEIDEVIETITTAATDSTPATTTTKTKRHITAGSSHERDVDTTETAAVQASESDVNFTTSTIHNDLAMKKNEETKEAVKAEKKMPPWLGWTLFSCFIAVISWLSIRNEVRFTTKKS